jgi:IMP dehydrogenase
VRDNVEIGMGKSARRGYHLDDVAIVPSRRTRDVDDVSISWQIDAFQFAIPLVAHPSDATMSPETVVRVGQLGGLGVLDAEGLWTRYDDPAPIFERIAGLTDDRTATAVLQEVYAQPVKPELVHARVKALHDSGVTTAVRISPQHTISLAPTVLDAGIDLLVIQGTIVSAEHVSSASRPLNLKEFIADLDLPVIVGGCANYQTALHLMRTGAAGVIVGMGADGFPSSDDVLGIRVPMATAIADAVAARRDYLDETGGRYVHVIADGDYFDSGDVVRALACGSDAVMLGELLAGAAEAPAKSAWWPSSAAHPKLPRGPFVCADDATGTLEEILYGPARSGFGDSNVFGALKRAMAKTGYSDLKEFQKVELVLDHR